MTQLCSDQGFKNTAAPKTSTAVRAAFVPVWDGNPYHPELITALRRHDVSVSSRHTVKEIFCGEERVDLLHVHSLPYFDCTPINVGRYARFFGRLRAMQKGGVRLVWTVHDFQNHDSMFWRLENWIARRFSKTVDAMIVHGDTARQLIEAQWGRKQITVIPHGHYIHSYPNEMSRTAARSAFGFDDSHVVFLFLGLIRPYKGVEELVRSFKRCGAPSARLVIAGRPVDEAMLRKVSSAAQSDSRIVFHHGFVAPEMMQKYMNAADVSVFPYLRVLTSGAAVLAMSFAKCCIAPRTGCIADVLDEKGALFFDPQRPGDLEAALTRATSMRQSLARMGQHNLKVAAAWDWDRVACATANVYRSVLGKVL